MFPSFVYRYTRTQPIGSVVILRYTVTPLGGWTSLYLEDLGDNEYTRGGSRVRTINNPFEFTESWQVVLSFFVDFFFQNVGLHAPLMYIINCCFYTRIITIRLQRKFSKRAQLSLSKLSLLVQLTKIIFKPDISDLYHKRWLNLSNLQFNCHE